MRQIRFFLFSLLFPLFLLATPAEVIIIRHGEKSGGPDLDQQGMERAAALAVFFQNESTMLKFGLPAAIYATQPDSKHHSQREIQTITPLAGQLNLQVLTPCACDDVDDLASLILNDKDYHGKMVLICWDHNRMGSMAAAFGVKDALPAYPDNRFDLIYTINFSKDNPTFKLSLQQLMFDDSAQLPAGFPTE